MDELKRFAQAIQAGAGIQAPETSIPELAGYMRSRFTAPLVGSAGAGLGAMAGVKADQEEKAAERARQAQIQKLQDKLDPGKYRKERKDDGGFSFYDPEGNEIDIDTYAKRTGQRRVDAIKDSENPIDLQYINDWQNMNDLMQATYNGDEDRLSEFDERYRKMKVQDLGKELINRYPHIYGMGQYERSLQNLNNPVFRKSAFRSGGGSDWDDM